MISFDSVQKRRKKVRVSISLRSFTRDFYEWIHDTPIATFRGWMVRVQEWAGSILSFSFFNWHEFETESEREPTLFGLLLNTSRERYVKTARDPLLFNRLRVDIPSFVDRSSRGESFSRWQPPRCWWAFTSGDNSKRCNSWIRLLKGNGTLLCPACILFRRIGPHRV